MIRIGRRTNVPILVARVFKPWTDEANIKWCDHCTKPRIHTWFCTVGSLIAIQPYRHGLKTRVTKDGNGHPRSVSAPVGSRDYLAYLLVICAQKSANWFTSFGGLV